jgi:WD40 repeat protein
MRAGYPVWSVAFAPDGRHVAMGSGGYDNSVQVWDIDTGTAGEPMVGHKGFSVHSVSFSRDGQHVVVGSHDGATSVWDVATRQVTALPGGKNAVLSVAYASTGRWLVSGDTRGTVRVWNGDNYEPVGVPIDAHQNWVTSVRFSSDDSRILTASLDGTLRFWPPPTDPVGVLCSKLASNMTREQWNAWIDPEIEYQKVCPNLA